MVLQLDDGIVECDAQQQHIEVDEGLCEDEADIELALETDDETDVNEQFE